MEKLFSRLCTHSALKNAWRSVRDKRAKGGLDRIQPQDMESDIDRIIAELVTDLRTRKYVPVPYEKSKMPKFNDAGEWRKLSLPSVRDKIVQHAFLTLTNPLFEKDFLDCSYAYRKGKGPVKAIRRAEHILSSHMRWTALMDIDDFFDTMDHGLLIEKIRGKITEQEMLNLVSLWLNAGIVGSRGEWDEPDEGIAQGSVVSPFFSNIYLHSLDQFATERKYPYIRYSDNFILFSKSKEAIYASYESIRHFLENELKLKLNDNPYPFKDTDKGFVFLGIYFRGDQRKISSGKESKILRKLDWMTDVRHQKDPKLFLNRLNESVKGTKRYYGFIKPEKQFEAFDRHLAERLRFLLVHFLKKEILSSREDVREFLSSAEFYAARSDADRAEFCRALEEEVYAVLQAEQEKKKAKPISPEKKAQAAQTKRQTARKSRFLRLTAGQAEVTISSPGLFVGKTGERLIIREQRKVVAELAFSKISNVSVSSPGISFSSDVIFQCSQRKIPFAFYNQKGQAYAILQSPVHSMGTVSVLQIRAYETETALELVKRMITGKAKNQMNLMKFYLRSRQQVQPDFAEKVRTDLKKMEKLLSEIQGFKLDAAYSVIRDRIFSAEARISIGYWGCMKLLVSPELEFVKRDRHNARDLVNNMLNYGYGILYQRVWQAVLKAGLNPHISFLHAFQASKPTLVYDMVEEFRQPFADRAVFSLLTRGKRGADLKLDKKTGLLAKETRNRVTAAVLARLSGLVHFRGKKMKGEDIIYIQAKNLADALEGKAIYKPFIARY